VHVVVSYCMKTQVWAYENAK